MMSRYCLWLASSVSDETFAAILMLLPLFVRCFTPLAALKVFECITHFMALDLDVPCCTCLHSLGLSVQ